MARGVGLDGAGSLQAASGSRELEQLTAELLSIEMHRVLQQDHDGLWRDREPSVFLFDDVEQATAAWLASIGDAAGETTPQPVADLRELLCVVHCDTGDEMVIGNETGVVMDNWSTLVNPQRDLGPQHIHGVRASDVRLAPTFVELAGDLAALLAGRVVVAHNLGFDLRFLRYEYERLGLSVPLDVEFGLCTMAMSERYLWSPSRSLAACCAAAGIRHDLAHSALHDARATAGLLGYLIRAADQPEPWSALFDDDRAWPGMPAGCGRTCQRSTSDVRSQSFLARLVDRLPRVPDLPHADDYLAVLDRALLDRHLSASEQDALLELAESLGLSLDTAMALHRRYLTALAQAAWEDGVVTHAERQDLFEVAGLLGLTADDVSAALTTAEGRQQPSKWAKFRLTPGDTVAFTGQMNGPRDEWERRAAAVGLTVTPGGVTKRTRLLVAADPDSLSGKAGKARQYGIPIVTEDAFAKLLDRMSESR